MDTERSWSFAEKVPSSIAYKEIDNTGSINEGAAPTSWDLG